MSALTTNYSYIPSLLTSAFSSSTTSSGPLPTANPLSAPDYLLAGSLSSLPSSPAPALTSALSNLIYGQDIAKLIANPSINGTLNTPTAYFQNLLKQLTPANSAPTSPAPATSTVDTTA